MEIICILAVVAVSGGFSWYCVELYRCHQWLLTSKVIAVSLAAVSFLTVAVLTGSLAAEVIVSHNLGAAPNYFGKCNPPFAWALACSAVGVFCFKGYHQLHGRRTDANQDIGFFLGAYVLLVIFFFAVLVVW